MRMLETEISRHDWKATECGCTRAATHVPEDFVSALGGPLPARIGEGWADNHVYIQSNLMEPALATAAMLVASLADRDVPLEWRPHILAVLDQLVCGEQEDVAEQCKWVVRGCTEILFEEIAAGRSKMAAACAFELLLEYPDLSGRLQVYQVQAQENLPERLHAKNLDLNSL
ncbi:hypothetical protein ACFY1L_12435 [Streptomyces sp. NPDC001663]|uniref:hypothetical protein n=1 Tax=Streptomyces sp. NPDC001663 TaxID=3364597 RepID=UPI00368E0E23